MTAGASSLDDCLLVGRYLSPFVRRVAVTMRHFGVPYRRRVLSTLIDLDEIATYNPVARVPVVVLASGDTVVDSAAILDLLDERAGPDRALMPPAGEARQHSLYALMVAVGAIERAMTANGEQRRSPDKQIPERLERLRHFARQGFLDLERTLGGRDWFSEDRMMQPDITTAVGLTFVRRVHPGLIAEGELPGLSRLTARCEDLPAFRAVWIDIET